MLRGVPVGERERLPRLAAAAAGSAGDPAATDSALLRPGGSHPARAARRAPLPWREPSSRCAASTSSVSPSARFVVTTVCCARPPASNSDASCSSMSLMTPPPGCARPLPLTSTLARPLLLPPLLPSCRARCRCIVVAAAAPRAVWSKRSFITMTAMAPATSTTRGSHAAKAPTKIKYASVRTCEHQVLHWNG